MNQESNTQPTPVAAALNIECETPVMLEITGVSGAVKGLLVGNHNGSCVILYIPISAGIDSQIHRGQLVTIRYMSRGTVYGFRSNILGRFMIGNQRYYFLTACDSVETVSLRKSPRIFCTLPASAKLEEITLEGVVINLADNGACFICKPPELEEDQDPFVGVGDQITLSGKVPGGNGFEDIVCLVRSFKAPPERWEMGLEFAEKENTAPLLDYLKVVLERSDESVLC